MHIANYRILLLTLLLVISTASFAKEVPPAKEVTSAKKAPSNGPVIKSFGPNYKIENRDVGLPESFVYKAIFDITRTSDEPDQINRSIESAARFINMHAKNGVAVENMKLVIVLHGASSKDTLNNTAYNKRYGVDNPNLKLIKALKAEGVKFYLCGQSASFGGIEKSELADEVDLALSAMTMFVTLQEQGYHLIP